VRSSRRRYPTLTLPHRQRNPGEGWPRHARESGSDASPAQAAGVAYDIKQPYLQ
jgi:hypothetical protein